MNEKHIMKDYVIKRQKNNNWQYMRRRVNINELANIYQRLLFGPLIQHRISALCIAIYGLCNSIYGYNCQNFVHLSYLLLNVSMCKNSKKCKHLQLQMPTDTHNEVSTMKYGQIERNIRVLLITLFQIVCSLATCTGNIPLRIL